MEKITEREFIEGFACELSCLCSYLKVADIYKDNINEQKERIVKSYNILKLMTERFFDIDVPFIEISKKTDLDFTHEASGLFRFFHWSLSGNDKKKAILVFLTMLRKAV